MTAVQGKKYLSMPVVFNGKSSLPRLGRMNFQVGARLYALYYMENF